MSIVGSSKQKGQKKGNITFLANFPSYKGKKWVCWISVLCSPFKPLTQLINFDYVYYHHHAIGQHTNAVLLNPYSQ
jgi:hypothetical protein